MYRFEQADLKKSSTCTDLNRQIFFSKTIDINLEKIKQFSIKMRVH